MSLFTELTLSEQASLSGGTNKCPDKCPDPCKKNHKNVYNNRGGNGGNGGRGGNGGTTVLSGNQVVPIALAGNNTAGGNANGGNGGAGGAGGSAG